MASGDSLVPQEEVLAEIGICGDCGMKGWGVSMFKIPFFKVHAKY